MNCAFTPIPACVGHLLQTRTYASVDLIPSAALSRVA